MYPRLYAEIEQAIVQGMPPHLVSSWLIERGWPEAVVNDALNSWLLSRNLTTQKTAFREWIKKYYRQALPAVVFVVFINLIAVSINLLKPWPLKILADSGFGNIPAPGFLEPYTNTPTIILATSIMTISLFVIGTLFGVFRDYLLLKIGFWLNINIKNESMRHILHLPLFHQERLSKGDYVYRQNVVTNSLSELVLGTTSSIAESIIVIAGVLGIMVYFNPGLTLISIILMPILFITMRLIGPRMGRYAKQLTEVASETSSRINESVDNAETVQAFNLEDKLLSKIGHLWNKSYELSRKNLLWGELLSGTNGFFIVLATSTVMYLGGTAALNGQLTLGELLIFMTYMGYLLDPVEGLVNHFTNRNQKIIDVSRIYDVLTDHEGIEFWREDNLMPRQTKGQIVFENVSYSYEDNIVFKNLNLTINQGQKVAIIGPSGGGKSTLLKLLPLFIQPEGGRIFIDGINSQTVSLQELRKRIAWVSQTPQLFEGTILENLMDGDAYRQISQDEVVDAIETAHVSEFAMKLPLGLASPAGENGSTLSGGQRQRVSIARALIKNAPIICLDEPTAALDAHVENLIRDSLMDTMEGKTVFMVTHRKTLLTLMDTIYVLEEGQLKNVNELGGLDRYLAQLENIEIQQAEAAAETFKSTNEREQANALFDEYVMLEQELNQTPELSTPQQNQSPQESPPNSENDETVIKIDHDE